MKAASYLLAVAVVGTGIFAFGPHHVGGSNAAYARPSAELPVVERAASAAAIVDTKDLAYAPAQVTLPAGATLRFVNSDSNAHSVTVADGSLDSVEMARGQSWSHVFVKRGTYAYFVDHRPRMHGKIVVK